MFTITPIGSCRITTPLKRGQDRHGFSLNMDKCYGYCHSPAEAVQMAQFMLGQINVPSDIWPLVSRAHDLNYIQAMTHNLSDLYVVELASAKEVTIDGVSIQLNYLNATYADFFADKSRAAAFWDMAESGSRADMTSFLAANWSENPAQKQQSEMLARIQMRRVTQQSLETDLRNLDALLGNVLIVSHIDARKADGRTIGSRSGFIEMVKTAAHKMQLAFDNPTDLMTRFGQSSALEDESAGLAHFTPDFGDALMQHWVRTVVAPMTDRAVASDTAAVDEWFIPQIMAAFENGEISDAVTRTQNLKQTSPSMLFLADELEGIKATSKAAFEKHARTAISNGITDDACISLIQEANGLGQFDLALELVENSDSGFANLSQVLSITLAERAIKSRKDNEALAFLGPYLAQGHATAIEMIADAYLTPDSDVLLNLPQASVAKMIAHLDMPRRISLIDLLGLDNGLAVTRDTTPDDMILAVKNLEAKSGFAAAVEMFALWHKQQDRKVSADASVIALLDDWVASSVTDPDLSNQIESLARILHIAPRHAAARAAQRTARHALMVNIRAAGDAGDLTALDAMAPTVAKLPALPEFELWRARLSFNNGDYALAIQLGERAAVDLPEKLNLWVLLMRAANRSDLFDQASNYAHNVVRLSQNTNEKLHLEAQAILQAKCVGG